jgi:hypothetical protein
MDHAASQHPLLVSLEHSNLGAAMRESMWLYPTVEILHIFGFILLVGSIANFDLRLLGLHRFVPIPALARHAVPLAMIGFCIAAPAGFLLFATEATSIAMNPAFQFKLFCVALGLTNAILFHLGPWRTMAVWGPVDYVPPVARLGAATSLLAWIGAVIGGRLIAYL